MEGREGPANLSLLYMSAASSVHGARGCVSGRAFSVVDPPNFSRSCFSFARLILHFHRAHRTILLSAILEATRKPYSRAGFCTAAFNQMQKCPFVVNYRRPRTFIIKKQNIFEDVIQRDEKTKFPGSGNGCSGNFCGHRLWSFR